MNNETNLIHKRNNENMYDVTTYTDAELFNILDLDAPTDRELEAKIIFLINKYKNMQNAAGDQLTEFFENIYRRFFVSEEEVENEEEEEDEQEGFENITEGFENITEGTSNQQIINQSPQEAKTVTNAPSNILVNNPLDKPTADNIGYTKSLDYANDKLNPLLQQTIKRVISIDSQYRDDKTTLSTEFTFNLSDPLKDVVSLKLYSVQIPYTWYTISNNFGSNFFVLKGSVDGIDDGTQDYQITILSGNYGPQALTDTINTSITTAASEYTDVSFGNTKLTYNSNTSLITTNIDIYRQFNETSYKLYFPDWIQDISSNRRKDTIPSFLGFTNQEYDIFTLKSATTLPLTTDTTNEQLRYTVDNTNNYFTVYKYIGDTYDNTTQLGAIIDLSFVIQLTLTTGSTYTRQQISDNLNTVLENDTHLIESGIDRIVSSNNTYFALKIKLNRYKTNNISGSKLQIQFPEVIPDGTRLKNIWTGSTSCFQFNVTARNILEINNILSETSPLPQSDVQYTVISSPYILLECNKYGYMVENNQYKIEVSNSSNGPYSLSSYISAINTGIQTVDNSSNFRIDNTFAKIDNLNRFNVQFDLTKTIDRTNFILDLSNSFLHRTMNFDVSYNLSTGGTFTSSFEYLPNYEIPSDGNFVILKAIDEHQAVSVDLSYNIVHPANTNTITNTTPYTTGTATTLENLLNNTFSSYTDTDNYQILNGTTITLIKRPTENIVDATLTINFTKQLTEGDYTVQFLEDTYFNISTLDFTINLSGGIGNNPGNYITFTENNYSLNNTSIIDNIGFLNTTFDLSGQGTISSNSYILTSQFDLSTSYVIDASNIAYFSIKSSTAYPYYGRSVRYKSTDAYSYLIPAPSQRTYNNYTDLVTAINGQFQLFPDLSGTNIQIQPLSGSLQCTLTVVINQSYNQDTWYKYLNVSHSMIDTSYALVGQIVPPEIIQNPDIILYTDLSYSAVDNYASVALGIKGYTPIIINVFNCNSNNSLFQLIPYDKGVVGSEALNNLNLVIPYKDVNGNVIQYTRDKLIEQMNKAFIGTVAEGSLISIITDDRGNEYTKIRITINKEYTAKDYRLVFYDPFSFVKCFSGVTSVRNVTWDTTMGWILGYRLSTIYTLSDYTTYRNATIIADTGISTNLFNYFLITLDDYNQNHLNDGLVTITTKETEIPLPSYASRTNYICDPVTNSLTYNTLQQTNYSKLTQNQLYSLTQITNSKNAANQAKEGQVSSRSYGTGPFAKDVFGMIPMKVSGLKNGDVYVEYGGTLQNQERLYFGPVNIHRMTVRLLGDRGDVVNLNGANWSFSLICEQLYKPQPNGKK
jgi:hypothetical protein